MIYTFTLLRDKRWVCNAKADITLKIHIRHQIKSNLVTSSPQKCSHFEILCEYTVTWWPGRLLKSCQQRSKTQL